MAKSLNTVTLMGRLTRDPEVKNINDNMSITSFSLAVDRQGKEDAADFFDIEAWNKLGELVANYLTKGRQCIVQGRLKQDRFEDKEGNKRSKIVIAASDVIFVGGREDSQPSYNAGGAQQGQGTVETSDNTQGGYGYVRPQKPALTAAQKVKENNKELSDPDVPLDLSEIPF